MSLMAGSRDCQRVPLAENSFLQKTFGMVRREPVPLDGVGDGACFASPLAMAMHPTQPVLYVADTGANRCV